MIETTAHRRSGTRTAIRVLVVFDAVTFLLAALLHLGVRIPLAFTVLAEPGIRDAAIVEGLAGLIFAVAVYAAFTQQKWAWLAAIVAYVFAFLGVLVGMNALAAGLGPRTVLNTVYHNLMLFLLVAGLVLLATPSAGVALGHGRPAAGRE